jgi:hypothetical protein
MTKKYEENEEIKENFSFKDLTARQTVSMIMIYILMFILQLIAIGFSWNKLNNILKILVLITLVIPFIGPIVSFFILFLGLMLLNRN